MGVMGLNMMETVHSHIHIAFLPAGFQKRCPDNLTLLDPTAGQSSPFIKTMDIF